MIWRLLGKSRGPRVQAAWWVEAERLADALSDEAVAELERAIDRSQALDEIERCEEMVDGLRALTAFAGATDLPVVTTQHRVIGADACHFMAPVSLAGGAGAPGKLFLTSRRLVVASAGVTALPWHRVRHLARTGRDVIVGTNGETVIHVICNSFGDALTARHLAARLMSMSGPAGRS